MAMTFGANNYINVVGAWTNLTVTTITLWVKINAFNAGSNRFIGSGQIYINGVLEASGVGNDVATRTTLSIGNRNWK